LTGRQAGRRVDSEAMTGTGGGNDRAAGADEAGRQTWKEVF
jgi:hypothetical protein